MIKWVYRLAARTGVVGCIKTATNRGQPVDYTSHQLLGRKSRHTIERLLLWPLLWRPQNQKQRCQQCKALILWLQYLSVSNRFHDPIADACVYLLFYAWQPCCESRSAQRAPAVRPKSSYSGYLPLICVCTTMPAQPVRIICFFLGYQVCCSSRAHRARKNFVSWNDFSIDSYFQQKEPKLLGADEFALGFSLRWCCQFLQITRIIEIILQHNRRTLSRRSIDSCKL